MFVTIQLNGRQVLIEKDKNMTKRITRKKDIPEGYFEETIPVDKESDLDYWKSWFKKKNIQTVTIERKGKFILCREGIEAIS